MAESTYKGDSPGKKLARARMWLNASKTMQSLSVPYMGTIALAGEGGDASTLRGYGIEPSSVCFADYDAESVEYCQELYPGSYGHVGDVGDMSKEVLYNAAHLDFCGGLTIKNILTAATVARNAGSYPMLLAVTMQCGREPRQQRAQVMVKADRITRRLWSKQAKNCTLRAVGSQLLRQTGTFVPELCINRAKAHIKQFFKNRYKISPIHPMTRTGKYTPLGNAMARADAMRGCLWWLLRPYGLATSVVSFFGYHSQSKQSGGTPFVTAMLIIHPSDMTEYMCDHMDRYGGDLIQYCYTSAKEAPEMLRNYALDFSQGGHVTSREVADIFDINPGKVAAWKAQEARGTYDGRERMARVTYHTIEKSEMQADPNSRVYLHAPLPGSRPATLEFHGRGNAQLALASPWGRMGIAHADPGALKGE